MTFIIQAPFGRPRSTHWFPIPEFGDSRATQARQILKRHTTGRLRSYITPSTKYDLVYRFLLTRSKDFELAEIIRVYHTVPWKITDHNGQNWKVQLTVNPVDRVPRQRIDSGNTRTGDEEVEVILRFSGEKVS